MGFTLKGKIVCEWCNQVEVEVDVKIDNRGMIIPLDAYYIPKGWSLLPSRSGNPFGDLPRCPECNKREA